MTWLPDVTGRAIDLVEPQPEQVDFAAIAHALSHVNRYGGNGDQPCSVALHTLIGLDLCPEPLKAHWLLHDCHEARLGDIATPVQEALAAVADAARPGFGEIVRRTIVDFKRRHDAVIHAAAGVPLPNASQREEIKALDRRCLATEHRDFHRPSERAWSHEVDGIAPAKHLRKWSPPDRVGEQLLDRFRHYLPRLRSGL